MPEIHIQSYFSLPTDLAAEMRDWPEFVDGNGYSVDLRDAETGEGVTVRLVDDEERPYVAVVSRASGSLFDRAVGRVVCALSNHSDNILVDRIS
jgi:hypothetical protein